MQDVPSLLLGSGVFLQGLVQGNLSREAALGLDSRVRAGLAVLQPLQPLPDHLPSQPRCQELPREHTTLRVAGLDTTDPNTLVTNYYQAGPGSLQEHALLETVVVMLEEPVFDTLRTQEQLGYHVNITMRNTFGVLGMSVTVNTQATKFTADHVDERIEAFFETFIAEQLTEEKVGDAVASLVKLKLRADVKLEEEVARNWGEIMSREYLFSRAEREVQLLGEVR